MEGWILLSRGINDHWIWKDSNKLKWWLDILLTVNFEDKKFTIGFKMFECKRGQSLMSIEQWAKRWNVSKSVANKFLKMLSNDNMIELKNETVTTRLTVCNYDTYQMFGNATETQRKRNGNATETQRKRNRNATHKQLNEIKEVNEINEIKEVKEVREKVDTFSFKNELLSICQNEKLVNDFLLVRKSKKMVNSETAFNILKKEIEKTGGGADVCLEMAIQFNWGGFKADWYQNKINQSNQQNYGNTNLQQRPNSANQTTGANTSRLTPDQKRANLQHYAELAARVLQESLPKNVH